MDGPKKVTTLKLVTDNTKDQTTDNDDALLTFFRSVYWYMARTTLPEDWVHAQTISVEIKVPYAARLVLKHFAEAIDDPVLEFTGFVLSELVRIGIGEKAMNISKEIENGKPIISLDQ